MFRLCQLLLAAASIFACFQACYFDIVSPIKSSCLATDSHLHSRCLFAQNLRLKVLALLAFLTLVLLTPSPLCEPWHLFSTRLLYSLKSPGVRSLINWTGPDSLQQTKCWPKCAMRGGPMFCDRE